MERLMLLDGYGLVYRGYFALPPLTTSRGDLVNGVFGFASIVLRGLQDLKPDYLAVSFDLPGPTFRHEQYAEYKATRTKMPDELRDQFPMVQRTVITQLGGIVMGVTEDVPHLQRQLLQQLWGDHIVSLTGDGKFRGQGEPDAPDRDG